MKHILCSQLNPTNEIYFKTEVLIFVFHMYIIFVNTAYSLNDPNDLFEFSVLFCYLQCSLMYVNKNVFTIRFIRTTIVLIIFRVYKKKIASLIVYNIILHVCVSMRTRVFTNLCICVFAFLSLSLLCTYGVIYIMTRICDRTKL